MNGRLQYVLDGLATAVACGRTGLRFATERAQASLLRQPRLPANVAEVSPAWLTECLQQRFLRASVETITPLGEHTGTTTRARLSVSYSGTGDGEQPPATVFVKHTPASTGPRVFGDLMGLGATEVRFYREIAGDVDVAVPDCYLAAHEPSSGRFLLLLEDLDAAGARFSDVSERASAELARDAVGALARLHAGFWNSRRLEADLAWLRSPSLSPTLRLERFICASAVGPGLARFPEVVPPEIAAGAARIIGARDRLDARWSTVAQTVIHGDSHLGNMYFIDSEVGLFDWQVVQRAPGMRDVSYFLVTSLPTDLRREHEEELIRDYLAELSAHGVEPPDFDEAWLQHRLFAMHAWIATVVTAAAVKLQPEDIARAGVARTCRAVLDLDSLDALDRV